MWYRLQNLFRNLITFIYHISLFIHFIQIIIFEIFIRNIHLNDLNLFSPTHAFPFNIASSLNRNIEAHFYHIFLYACTRIQLVSSINSHFERKWLSHYICD